MSDYEIVDGMFRHNVAHPRVLVCGSREWNNRFLIDAVFSQLPDATVIIHGAARGADKLAGEIAAQHGFEVLPFPAEWAKFDKAAGPIRNQRMLDEGKPTEVIAFHRDLSRSKGTRDMLNRALQLDLPIAVYGLTPTDRLVPLRLFRAGAVVNTGNVWRIHANAE